MKYVKSRNYFLFAIVCLASFLRFYDLNWDQGTHLHPDERFLTLVGIAMKMPATFAQYLNPATSPFNPANIGYQFYVYGTLPVVLNKLLAFLFMTNDYGDFTLQGRFLSGLSDVGTVIVIYKLLQLFESRFKFKPSVKYWGAFFYSIAVLPIQLSHFFTVDTFLTFFLIVSFYFVVRFSIFGEIRDVLVSAIFLGFATGTKATSVYMIPLIGYFLVSFVLEQRFSKITFFNKPVIGITKISVQRRLLQALSLGIVYGIFTYFATRLSDPYLFQTGNLLNPQISLNLLASLKALAYWSSPAAWYPPSVQWVSKTPVLFSIKNLIIFGVGMPYTILMLYGMWVIFKRYRKPDMLVIIFWCLGFFLYQSAQFVQTMRYFIIIYPFLAIFAALGTSDLTKHWKVRYLLPIILLVIIWPMMFFSIYTKPQSRVTASEWMYQNFPNGSVLLNEYWDDPLPLLIPQSDGKQFTGLLMPVFDQDTTAKWATMDAMLKRGNYLILSSNRGWGSIPTVPSRYPLMTQFYKNLFAGRTNYKKIADFTSYPSLSYLGIPITIPDDWAEEAFTVYDHPHVMVFENMQNKPL